MTPELRVLSGLHKGANCTVRDGDLIGRDIDCDVVLMDDGFPVRVAAIRLGDSGWSMESVPGVDSDDMALPDGGHDWNAPWRLADVWLTIACTDAPWIQAPADSSEIAARHADFDANTDTGVSGAELLPGAKRWPPRASRASRWLTRGLLALVAVAVLATIAVLIPGRAAAPPVRPPVRNTTPEQGLGAITAAIDQLGLASRLHVSVGPDGGLVVRGWVVDQAEGDRLAQALSRVWPMPAMRVSNQSIAMHAATTALAAHRLRFEPVYLGQGRMAIHGIALDARERAAALDAVRACLPGMTVMGNDILLPTQVEHALAKRLQAAGLTGITLSWDSSGLRVAQPNLSDARLAAFLTLLAAFNKEFFDIARIGDAGASTGATSDRVPFEIRSVMGGPQPFIVLDNGMKLVPGGSYRGYRLVTIEPGRLTFDGVRKAIVLR